MKFGNQQNQGATLNTAEETFRQKYWFGTLQFVTVLNPLAEDAEFMCEGRSYRVVKGGSERYPGPIANVYLDYMSKDLAQRDDNFGNMADPVLRAQYYDKLIARIDDMVQEFDNVPDYLRAPAAAISAPKEPDANEETPFAQVQVPATLPPATKREPETKEFDYNGDTYKLVVNKNGDEMYYKNGRMMTKADYYKAASMV